MAGVAVDQAPMIVIGCVLVGLMFLSPVFRTLVVVFGGLFVFQASSDLTPTKVAYLLATLLAFCIAAVRMPKCMKLAAYDWLRPLLLGGAVLGAFIAFTFLIALNHGTPASSWLRDAAPFFLLALVPVFALDISTFRTTDRIRNVLQGAFVVAGTTSAVSVLVEWLGSTRRNLADLPVSHILFPTFMLAAALFCYGIAKAIGGGRLWLLWGLLAGAIGIALLVTGSRSSLVLFVAGPVIFLMLRRAAIHRWARGAILIVVGGVLLFFSVQALNGSTAIDLPAIADRFGSIPRVLSSTQFDASYQERLGQTNAAVGAFVADPVFGTGPGYVYRDAPITAKYYAPGTAFDLDTPAALPAKFGLVGLAVFAFVAALFVRSARRLRQANISSPAVAALVAFGLIAVVWTINTPAFQDKGFAFGLLLLLSLVVQAPTKPIGWTHANREHSRDGQSLKPVG